MSHVIVRQLPLFFFLFTRFTANTILCKADYPFFMIITRNITCNVEHRMLKYSRNQK